MNARGKCCAVLSKRTYSTTPFQANGITYNPPPNPVAVICIDGCENEYLDVALSKDCMPNLSNMLSSQDSFRAMSKGALPSFTNTNNCSIISGCPPYKHGISGNYFVDSNNNEVMMNSNKYFECDNILEKALLSKRKVSMITAKDKLRDLLGGNNIIKSKPNGIALSTEYLKDASYEMNGIEYEYIINKLFKNDVSFNADFSIYSGDASINVLKIGTKLIEHGLSDFAYLSLSDYIQHKHAPHSFEAIDFYQQIDEQIGYLMDLQCTIGITADHGMNDKTKIVYLQRELDEAFEAEEDERIRVICPITDPYVVHHGSLGSFVYIYIKQDDDFFEDKYEFEEYRESMMEYIEAMDGIKEVYDRDTAMAVLQLPHDRIGDITVIADKHVALGKYAKDHQLDHVANGLRTHGGRSEEMVPFIINRKLNDKYSELMYKRELRNFHIFDFVCNGTQ